MSINTNRNLEYLIKTVDQLNGDFQKFKREAEENFRTQQVANEALSELKKLQSAITNFFDPKIMKKIKQRNEELRRLQDATAQKYEKTRKKFDEVRKKFEESKIGQGGSPDFLVETRDIVGDKAQCENDKYGVDPTLHQNRSFIHERHNSARLRRREADWVQIGERNKEIKRKLKEMTERPGLLNRKLGEPRKKLA